jgi:hypothetical protein
VIRELKILKGKASARHYATKTPVREAKQMLEDERIRAGFARRQFLQATFSSALVGIAAQAGVDFVSPTTVRAQANLSLDAALQELVAGNQRFAANQLTSIEHDLAILKERTVDRQER